jgi:hypothetical protein
MIWISHRGNLSGPCSERENHPDYIIEALLKKYDVEIDVWFVKGEWFLGHDSPSIKIEESFLQKPGLWCHAKSLESLVKLTQLKVHCFFHQNDDYTLTSQGIVWGHVKALPPVGGIHVMPETSQKDFSKCLGICSDFVVPLKTKFEE